MAQTQILLPQEPRGTDSSARDASSESMSSLTGRHTPPHTDTGVGEEGGGGRERERKREERGVDSLGYKTQHKAAESGNLSIPAGAMYCMHHGLLLLALVRILPALGAEQGFTVLCTCYTVLMVRRKTDRQTGRATNTRLHHHKGRAWMAPAFQSTLQAKRGWEACRLFCQGNHARAALLPSACGKSRVAPRSPRHRLAGRVPPGCGQSHSAMTNNPGRGHVGL